MLELISNALNVGCNCYCCCYCYMQQVPETKGLTLEELNGEDFTVDPDAIAAGDKAAAIEAV